MIDSFVLLTPILLLGVIALLGFVGCNQFFGLHETTLATAPDPPTNLTATPGDNQVVLTWGPVPSDVLDFQVSRGESPPGVVPTEYPDGHTVQFSELPYVDKTVVNGHHYHFVVAARNDIGLGGNSNDAEATPVSPFGPFVGSFVAGTAVFPGNGWNGMAIRVGMFPITVQKLGRAWELGLNNNHAMRLVDGATNADLSSTVVTPMSEKLGQFQYGSLSQGVQLNPGGLYYVLSQEASGGDQIYDQDTTVSHRTEATVPSAAYSTAPGVFVAVNSTDHAYGPVNIQY